MLAVYSLRIPASGNVADPTSNRNQVNSDFHAFDSLDNNASIASEMISFIKRNAHGLVESVSQKERDYAKRNWLSQVASKFASTDQIEHALISEQHSASSLNPPLVQLSSLVASLAIMDGSPLVLQEYLDLKVFESSAMRFYRDPVMDLAIRENQKPLISLLSDYSVRPTSEFLLESIAKGNSERVAFLLEYGAPKSAYFMLGPDSGSQSEPGIKRIKTILAELDDVLDEQGGALEYFLYQDFTINSYLYKEGSRSLYRAWSPIMVAAAGDDLKTLGLLLQHGFKPFKMELDLMSKIAKQMLKLTENRKAHTFRFWWNASIELISLGTIIGGMPFIPENYRVSVDPLKAVALYIGGSLLGNLGSYLVKRFWTHRDDIKKRMQLAEPERQLYDHLMELDRQCHTNMEKALMLGP